MTDDQHPPADRLWLWFAVSSFVFLGVLAISPVKDHFQEYRRYQGRYREFLIQTAASRHDLREAEGQRPQIRQIWLPEFDNRVDRCVTCHLGVESSRMAGAPAPFGLHPRTPHTPGDISRFGCAICHRGQGRATSLEEAHGRVPDWDSPILPVRYTEASCGQCHTGEFVPEASLLSQGRALMRRSGCYGCHRFEGQESWRSDAPDLDGLSRKTSVVWLRAWLKAPRLWSPRTWMPDFHLSDGEADSLIAFLWAQPPPPEAEASWPGEDLPAGDAVRGRVVFGESRCISCHTIDGRGNGSAPELVVIGSKVNRKWLVGFLANPHAFQPGTTMPRYDFSRQDLLDLSQYMMEEFVSGEAPPVSGPPFRPARRAIDAGEKLYKKYGCGGCHRIAGRSDAAPIGPDLTGIGDKPAALLDFGARDDLPRRLPDWLAAKASAPRSFRAGLRMPDLKLGPDEIAAIVTALLSSSSATIPEGYRVREEAASYAPPGRFGALVDRYRCLSCHEIQGAGGDIAAAALTAEGSKVRRDWLKRYLLVPTAIRPILTDRMIPLRMPPDVAGFLADFMAEVYVDNRIPDDIFLQGLPPLQVERGRTLFYERYGCQACHSVGGHGGSVGPFLDGAREKLKSGWIFWWLRGPQQWRPDVRCPDHGLDETDARDLAAFVMSVPAAAATPEDAAPMRGSP